MVYGKAGIRTYGERAENTVKNVEIMVAFEATFVFIGSHIIGS